MTPVEASKKKNESTVYFNLYGDMQQLSSKPRFKVGDKVRISKYKRKVFDKGYTPNWTEEIFLIDKIQSTNPMNDFPVIGHLVMRTGLWDRQGASIASRYKEMYGVELFLR